MKSTKSMVTSSSKTNRRLGRIFSALMTSAVVGFSSSSLAYEVNAYADGLIGHTTTPGDISYPYTFDGGFYVSFRQICMK